MDFYLDFEAYQYSGRVLSIGCVDANNEGKFSRICKSPTDKITSLIEGLTGITQEMVDSEGVEYNTAFKEFFQWIAWYQDMSLTLPRFFVYGNEDVYFVRQTMKYLTSPEAYAAAAMIVTSIVDLSVPVRQHLLTNGISLKRALELVRHEEVIQNHDAFEDAVMLKELAENFQSLEPIGDKIISNKMTVNENLIRSNNYKKMAQAFIDGRYTRDNAPTGSEDDWLFSWSYKGKTKYFSSTAMFGVWYARYFLNVSKTNVKKMKEIDDSIKCAIRNNHPTWKKKHTLTINPTKKEVTENNV